MTFSDDIFSDGFNTRVDVTYTFDRFAASLEPVQNFLDPRPTGTILTAREMHLEITDRALNERRAEIDISGVVVGTNQPFLNQGVFYWNVESVSSPIICNIDIAGDCGFTPQEMVITGKAKTQNAGSTSPIVNVFPIRMLSGTPSLERWEVLPPGSFVAAALAQQDVGNTTEHTWEITIKGKGLPEGLYEFSLLGMNAGGNGLRTPDNFFRAMGG